MYRVYLLFFSSIFFPGSSAAQNYPLDYFISPVDIPLYLSGTFGELRSNHFHSGIDIKTNGREGQPVLAAADGVVYRIKVSPYGFGNALYIRHPNGYSTVYAHLQRFDDQIQDYVKREQYRQKSYAIELYPPADRFSVKKGDIIALSGNSGGSGGPHLHFEIRDTRTEKIINPLLFGFDVKDTRYPDLYDLSVYEFNGDDMVASENHRLIKISGGEYRVAGNGLIEVDGKPAFGISAFDRLDGASNKNGVYQIGMSISGEKYYDFTMNTFAFDESRYINSHIDFGQKTCCGKTISRLYLEPNNNLSVYGINKKMNFPNLEKDSVYDVKIEVKDVTGNTSTLNFQLKKSLLNMTQEQVIPTDFPLFKYDSPNQFQNDNVSLSLPEGALYRDIYFEYRESEACRECLSPVYTLGAKEIPVHKYYSLKLKPSPLYKGDRSKLAIASIGSEGQILDFEGSGWENGYVTTRTRQFGDFAVVADSLPPVIVPLNFSGGEDVSRQKLLRIKVVDDFSGIDQYSAEIDGQWVLMSFDAKHDLLIINRDDIEITSGKHTLYLSVTDEMGNRSTSEYELVF